MYRVPCVVDYHQIWLFRPTVVVRLRIAPRPPSPFDTTIYTHNTLSTGLFFALFLSMCVHADKIVLRLTLGTAKKMLVEATEATRTIVFD